VAGSEGKLPGVVKYLLSPLSRRGRWEVPARSEAQTAPEEPNTQPNLT